MILGHNSLPYLVVSQNYLNENQNVVKGISEDFQQKT